jgi:hypothetical protein
LSLFFLSLSNLLSALVLVFFVEFRTINAKAISKNEQDQSTSKYRQNISLKHLKHHPEFSELKDYFSQPKVFEAVLQKIFTTDRSNESFWPGIERKCGVLHTSQ